MIKNNLNKALMGAAMWMMSGQVAMAVGPGHKPGAMCVFTGGVWAQDSRGIGSCTCPAGIVLGSFNLR